jgi:hypothetical protein
MRIIYPYNPLNSKEADEPYQDEYLVLKSACINCSLFDFDTLNFDGFKPKPKVESGESILYRGWMLNPDGYKRLVTLIEGLGAYPITSYDNYIKCHHLPGWYEQCVDYTSETKFFSNDEKLRENIASLKWDAYFIKDFVKSNTTEKGSIASSPSEAIDIVQLIQKYRGEIEGGIAVRRVERYLKDTETRYFVMNSKVYSPDGETPEILKHIVKLVKTPFYSVDIIQREDGELRVVEIGDGQVSDKKTWDTTRFTQMLMENT